MKEVKERQMGMHAARFCKEQLRMSSDEFKETIESRDFADEEFNDALWALKERGELNHLIAFVWSFAK